MGIEKPSQYRWNKSFLNPNNKDVMRRRHLMGHVRGVY